MCLINNTYFIQVEYPILFSDFVKREFPLQIFKRFSSKKFYVICPVAADLFHADGRTDRHMTKLVSLFAILRKP